MKIHSYAKTYDVNFYNDFSFVDELFALPNKLVVVDKNVYSLYKEEIFSKLPQNELFLIEAIEENKIIECALSLCSRMTEIPAKKNANLISFGGGIIQDITGFAANILYRGINWNFVPTTLLAQADSCIGSKTSLNYLKYKNLLGTFYPPNAVHICPQFVKTLSKDDYFSGLGEIVKFNVMAAQSGIEKLECDIDRLAAKDDSILTPYIERSLSFKKTFIEEDEFDAGIRRHLNFAHTFGHALETLSEYAVPHGQAVSIGMLIANRVSVGRNQLDNATCNRIENIVKKVISVPLKPEYFVPESIIENMKQDKKRQGDGLAAVLIDDALELHIVFDVTPIEVADAIKAAKDLLDIN